MKFLSKTEMEVKAIEALKKYPKVNKVHVTSDGQAFADEYVQAAQTHAKNNRHKKELTIQAFTRDELASKLSEKPKTPEKTPENAIKDIDGATAFLMGDGNIEDIDYNNMKDIVKWLALEAANQQKATLIAALEAKRAELKSE